MREIKFRVFFYDGLDKSTGEYFDAGYALNEDYIYFNGSELKPTDECSIIEQYTGLKDKNGVEIYEGDICKIKFDPNKVEDYIFNSLSDEEIFNCSKIFIVESPIFNNQVEFTADYIEVIGNIHQNPELL